LCEYGLLGFVLFCLPILVVGFQYGKKFLAGRFDMGSPTDVLAAITLFFFIIFMAKGGLASIWPLVYLVAILAPSNDKTENMARTAT
jgi:fatty acid desaturase